METKLNDILYDSINTLTDIVTNLSNKIDNLTKKVNDDELTIEKLRRKITKLESKINCHKEPKTKSYDLEMLIDFLTIKVKDIGETLENNTFKLNSQIVSLQKELELKYMIDNDLKIKDSDVVNRISKTIVYKLLENRSGDFNWLCDLFDEKKVVISCVKSNNVYVANSRSDGFLILSNGIVDQNINVINKLSDLPEACKKYPVNKDCTKFSIDISITDKNRKMYVNLKIILEFFDTKVKYYLNDINYCLPLHKIYTTNYSDEVLTNKLIYSGSYQKYLLDNGYKLIIKHRLKEREVSICEIWISYGSYVQINKDVADNFNASSIIPDM